MKPLLLLSSLVFLSVPFWAGRVRPDQYEGGRSKDEHSGTVRNSSALARMLGEYRAMSSDVLLMKTENYLHSGVGYEMHVVNDPSAMSLGSQINEMKGHQQEVGATGDHAHEHEGNVATLIKPPAEDYRGFLGDWLRQVKPWKDPKVGHNHTDGRELLPWFRVMTFNNPHYIRAYAMGAWWLIQEDIDQAESFIREGIRNNPKSFLVRMILAEVEMTRARRVNKGPVFDPDAASLPLFRKAAGTYHQAAELAFAERPKDMENLPEYSLWKHYLDDDSRRTMEMAVITERQFGDAAKARELARRYAPLYPKSSTLSRAASE